MMRPTMVKAGAFLLALAPCFVMAKPGAVTTVDGSVFVGEVIEQEDKVTVTDGTGPGIEINKANIEKKTFFENAEEEYKVRVGRVDARDVKGHLGVAKWAINHDHHKMARQSLDTALKLDPANVEGKSLREELDRLDKAKAPVKPVDPVGEKMPAHGPTRLVTKEEVNQIRQVEWQPGDQGVRVSVDKDVKANFIARSRDMTPQAFNRMPPNQQGWEILKTGTKEMREGVHLTTDPATLADYRKNVQKILITGCATTGCHDPSASHSFTLQTEVTDEAVYTNFLTLQNYRTKVNGIERLMIDRDQPNDSLLAQYMLAPKVADTAHPEVKDYKGISKNVNDQRFKLISKWLTSFPSVQKNYGVDLSRPPVVGKKEVPADADAPKKGEKDAPAGEADGAMPGKE